MVGRIKHQNQVYSIFIIRTSVSNCDRSVPVFRQKNLGENFLKKDRLPKVKKFLGVEKLGANILS